MGSLEHVNALQVLGSLHKARSHGLLAGAQADAGIVVLLVGLVLAVGVADLRLEVIAVLRLEGADAVPEGPLGVGVDVHLDDASLDRVLDVLDRRPRPTVEDKAAGQRALGQAELLRDVLLAVVEDLGLEIHVAGGVHAVHVAEGGGDGEGAVLDLGELLVRVPDLLGLRVETRAVNIRVVDAVLLTARHAELHLEEHVALGKALEVLLADLNVLLERLLREVESMCDEKRGSPCSLK
mmetsp:Transcript_7250/g.14044  ORF Transcript_7250/g.14044 Transcript_7250/m.14044 type:complete len:238 (-) Transcript_7250:651-1364(-)